MSKNKEELTILQRLLKILIEEEKKILNIKDKTEYDVTRLNAIKSLKDELSKSINKILNSENEEKITINGIEIANISNLNEKYDSSNINSYLQGLITELDPEEMNKDNKPKQLEIGDIITIPSDSMLYENANDLMTEENGIKKISSDTPKMIIGISIYYEDEIINILPNIPDYKQVIDNLLLDGGQLLGYIISEKESLKYDIENLSDQELNNLIIGFYDNKKIQLQKKRGKI